MERLGREVRLPEEMQGRWVDAEDPSAQLLVDGGEITCFGSVVEYDYKMISETDGALTVDLKVTDADREDTFERANITSLVITPDGEFFGSNVKFGVEFVRADP